MINIELLRKIEGWQSAEDLARELNIKKESAINLISRLKKEGYVSTIGGGRKVRIYKIKSRKQRKRDYGMFDIINKYSTRQLQISEWYDHQVHGVYGPEEALIDAIGTQSFRVILASLHLFKHITDWKKLYKLANERDCWNKVGALYDVARLFFKAVRIPSRYYHVLSQKWVQLSQLRKKNFPDIAEKWRVFIPFNINDMREA